MKAELLVPSASADGYVYVQLNFIYPTNDQFFSIYLAFYKELRKKYSADLELEDELKLLTPDFEARSMLLLINQEMILSELKDFLKIAGVEIEKVQCMASGLKIAQNPDYTIAELVRLAVEIKNAVETARCRAGFL